MTATTATPLGYLVEAGRPHPLGATPDAEGVNFSLFAGAATEVTLLLFSGADDRVPIQTVRLDPETNRTFQFWHVYVRGATARLHYAYRVGGPWDPSGSGHRYNPEKVLIDPYGRGVTHPVWNRARACDPDDNLECSMRTAVIDLGGYDWEGDRPLNRPMNETIIYEVHVGGFTRSLSSAARSPGTFAGIVEKIPYLQRLGITAVELLPVFCFDPTEGERVGPDGRVLSNYWGYSTVGFFSPHPAYCQSPHEASHITEFRDMVKALHRAGIEVILDVVFNHTSEGNQDGPVMSFKGLANYVYYHLSPEDRQFYMNYSGCGNTVNCNHPIVEKFVRECLEFWTREMHVDGFRFDEASILSRGPDGAPLALPPLPWDVELSEALADVKIIAEAWDAAGLYQVGYFPGYRWAAWNGRYRDDIRRFVRGDEGLVGVVASRIAGSADIFQPGGHQPVNSINFITAHDGFTLNDLVTYNGKHNQANGEDNRDGNDDNSSWNCGVEGDTNDPLIDGLRRRQIKNFIAILMLSQGVPMVLAGDEARGTQHGNNNAYCQDNPIGWFDWELVERNHDIVRFFSEAVSLRKRHPILHRARYFKGTLNERGLADVTWHGCRLNSPGWSDPASSVLAFTLGGPSGDDDLHVTLNMSPENLDFDLPPVAGRAWWRVMDTSLPSPGDIVEPGAEVEITTGSVYRVSGRSVVVLISRPSVNGELP
ncbi:MAG TPA: glycogen debranching protein GlgX [Candidatus Dormibacteraeota bacterium]